MDPNTHSNQPPGGGPDRLASVAAANHDLADEVLDQLSEVALSEDVQRLRQQLDAMEGQWLWRLAALDARGAAGADQGELAGSTAGWLRLRLRMSASAARSTVRTARVVFSGSLPETAAALLAGEISPAHAQVIAEGTHDLAEHVRLAADPLLCATAGQVDPPQLRRLVGHLVQVADPDGADRERERRHDRRGVWLAATFDGMVAIDGLLEPEAGATVMAALEPLARPHDAHDTRKGGQRTADALTELARRALEGGRLPEAGGMRPQLLVTVDVDTLLGRTGAVGGDLGWAGPLDREACRRLACDGAVTRVMVSRQPDPTGQQPNGSNAPNPPHDPATGPGSAADPDANGDDDSAGDLASGDGGLGADPEANVPAGLQAHLRAAMVVLPLTLGDAPAEPLEVGRATRVIQPAQRMGLAVRDGGCVFPGCDRPRAWCDAHHLWHWIDGGPTNLSNLALVCRAHHRAVHEEGWQLTRGPDGRFTATPTDPRPQITV